MTAAVRNCDKLKVGQVADTPRPAAVGTCKAEARDYPNAAKPFRGVANRAGQCGVDVDGRSGHPRRRGGAADRTSLIRAENVVPLYRRNELSEMQVLALNEVAGVLDTAGLVQMRRQVDAGSDPAHVADGFLAEHPLGATSR